MHDHLLGLEAQHTRRRASVQSGTLAADPQLGALLVTAATVQFKGSIAAWAR